ncbi:MAG: hypothetical protein D3904_00895 [Candidatus Electrothrix sp. EH2]|nr:hypothetical protein [Candidatus Electrothrix sp. EH2]
MELLGLVYNIYGNDYTPEIVSDSLRFFKDTLMRYDFPERIVLLPDIQESRSARWDILFSEPSGKKG